MADLSTDDVLEWRVSLGWVLERLALPMVSGGILLIGWFVLRSINPAEFDAPILAHSGLFIGIVLLATLLASAVELFRVLSDPMPVLRADRHGLTARGLFGFRTLSWSDVTKIEIEEVRRLNFGVAFPNQLLVYGRGPSKPGLVLKPQITGRSLDEGYDELNALWMKYR